MIPMYWFIVEKVHDNIIENVKLANRKIFRAKPRSFSGVKVGLLTKGHHSKITLFEISSWKKGSGKDCYPHLNVQLPFLTHCNRFFHPFMCSLGLCKG